MPRITRSPSPHPHSPAQHGPEARRARAPAAHVGGDDADGSRRRPLLEGVRQPDRARQDAPDEARRSSGSLLRLGVDAGFLANGVSANERGRIETVLTRAEALTEDHRYDEALVEYEKVGSSIQGIAASELEVRALGGEAWARMQEGQLREASELLDRARQLTESPSFSDVDRADVLFRLGVCRYKLQSISTALGLFNESLTLAERSGMPCDLLRSNILGWRSRCYRRQRDYEAAREDVERALELAEGLNDRRTVAHVYFQASLLAERDGHWVLARSYAERAKAQYEEIADRANVGKLLNNLGGLNFLLGKPDEAVTYLKDAYKVLLEYGTRGGRGARGQLARAGAPTLGRRPPGRGAGAPGTRAAQGPRRPPRRDRQRAARPRPRAARAGPARRGGFRLPRSRVELRTAFQPQPSSRSVDRAGRPGDPPRRRSRGSRPLQARGRGAPGRSLLIPRKEVTKLKHYNNARILLLLALAIAAAVTGGGMFDGHIAQW